MNNLKLKSSKVQMSESWLFPTVLPGWAAILHRCRLRADADSKIAHCNTFIRICRDTRQIFLAPVVSYFWHLILSHGWDVISEETQILFKDQWLKVDTFIQRIFSDGQDGHRPADTSVIQSPVITWWHHRCHLRCKSKFFTNPQIIWNDPLARRMNATGKWLSLQWSHNCPWVIVSHHHSCNLQNM